MNAELDLALAERRRRRRRGWLEIGFGLALITAAVVVTWFTFARAVARGGGTHLVWNGAAVAGFLAFIRGLLRLLRVEEDVHALGKPPKKPPTALTVGVGFKTFVAWRYLMARDHRISRPVLVVFLSAVFLLVMGGVLERSFIGAANRVDPGLANTIKGAIVAMKVGGVVLVFATLIVGALRYVFSFFTTVPLVGVWIGTGALVCVLAVMSGFETDLREKILGSNAHIQVTREDGEFTNWREIKARIDKVPGVVASSPYAVSEVVIAANNNGMNVIIKGIDPATVGKVTDLIQDLTDKDAIKRLEPLVDDTSDLTVPDQPAQGSGDVVDPPPADMPGTGEPIDFSKPKEDVVDPDQPAPIDEPPAAEAPPPGEAPPPPLPEQPPADVPAPAGIHAGSAGSSTAGIDAGSGNAGIDEAGSGRAGDDYGGDANAVQKPVLDPPPPDLVTSDEPPQDFSASSDDEDAVRVIDVPMEPSLSRRTQSLPGILVGRELQKQTHLYTGEEVRIVSPLSDPSNPDATGTPIPFNRDYRVAGIFYTGMYEYDLKYVYVTLDSLTDFLDRGDAIDGIEVRIGSPDDTDAYVGRLQTLLGKQYRVQDWKELNRSLFSALKLEKIAMFLVLGIVILVASFSIVGNLIMVVVEKGREIALLKTLGASDRSVMLVFAIQGLLIGVIGTGLGVSTGLLACWFGKQYGIPLNPDVYYINRMPVHVDPTSVLITAAAGVLISMAATFYPALVAARVRPAAGMRH
jgi:lipoprotein-releasing system permease protein